MYSVKDESRPFSRAVQAVLLYRLQNAKYRLDSAGQLPYSPFLTADGAEVFVRWQTPVVRWQNLSSRPGYVRILTAH
jgi:hypothetical protein